jgi:hypothetical protein
MVDAVGTGALLAADSGPELPTVNDFLPPEILFQGTPFAINRIIRHASTSPKSCNASWATFSDCWRRNE